MKKYFLTTALFIGLLAPRVHAFSNKATVPLSDKEIIEAAQSELRLNPAINSENVNVMANNGVVSLSGSVGNLHAKDAAVAMVHGIRGVGVVIDHLTIRPVIRTDAEIQSDVREALRISPALENRQLNATVAKGVATLTGSVDSYAEKSLAMETAKDVKGLREIQNDIQVDYKANRSDAEIQRDVEGMLSSDIWFAGDKIQVGVKNGGITLRGTVGSGDELLRATTKVWVAGAKSIDASGLKVALPSHDEYQRRLQTPKKSDSELTKAVRNALRNDIRIYSFNADVQTQRGVVTLSGTVDTLMAKQAAEEDAAHTVGVWKVNNQVDIRLENAGMNLPLGATIEKTLAWDPYLDGKQVHVSVKDGVATLTGIVETPFEKRRAESVATWMKGVTRIDDKIELDKAWPTRSDQEIKADIDRRLEWSPFVNADVVTVTVTNGVALLNGIVDSWAARLTLIEAAFDGGAREVVADSLNVRSSVGRAS